MADDSRLPRLAVLIDADNTSPRIAAGLFEEVAKFGEASGPADLRRFLRQPPEVVGGHPPEIRDRPVPAVRLHDRQRTPPTSPW